MKQTDCTKTYNALYEAGSKGIHSFTLGSMIGTIRIAARINDLRKMGHTISSVSETLGHARGVRYTLFNAPKRIIRYEIDIAHNTSYPIYG